MFTKLSDIGQIICVSLATIGTVITDCLGGWDMSIKVLIGVILIDYITGVICAIIDKKLSSEVGFKGIAKKIFILLLIAMCSLIDEAIGTDFIRNFAIMFYVANEGISILENSTKLGVPYPEKIKDILVQLKENNSKDNGGV